MATNPQASIRTANDYHAGTIGNLDDAWTRRLVASVVDTESSGGRLDADNGYGYYGRYQGGAGWLTDAGLVNREKYEAALKASGFSNDWDWGVSGGAQRFLADPANWNNGLSLDRYLASADIQDQAFRTNSNATYQRAVNEGVLSADTPPNVVAGFLKARHLGGYDNAIDAAQGQGNVADNNGTTTGKYYNDIARNNDGFDRHFVPGFQRTQTELVINPMADGVLKHGERGDAVIRLQEALNAAGIRDANGQPLPTTGYYGDMTRAAVRQYQEQHHLHVDGKAGKDTLTALGIYDELRQGAQPPSQTTPPQQPPAQQPPAQQPPAHQPPAQQPPAAQPPATHGGNTWPAPGNFTVNRADKPGEGDGEFGTSRGDGSRQHKGIDIQGRVGDPIESFGPGRVIFSGQMQGYGNTVVIQHDNGLQTLYGHLDSRSVAVGAQVTENTVIGTMGRSGNTPSQGDTHLHFEVRENSNGVVLGGQAVDPRKYLEFPPRTLMVHGDQGPDVKRLQETLNAAGIRDANGQPLPTTGYYGDMTEAAVRRYQEQHQLDVDGKAGRDTLTALGIYPGQQQTQTPPAEQPPATNGQTQPPQAPPQQPPSQTSPPAEQPPATNGQTQPPQAPPQQPPSQTSPPAEQPPATNGQTQPPQPSQTDKPSMADPRHPDNAMYRQALANLEQLGPGGGFKSREELERAAAAVTADARASGLSAIDHIAKTNAASGNQTLLVAVQGDPTNPASKNSYIDYAQATTQTLDQSSRMAEATRTQQATAPDAPQPENRTVGGAR